MAHSVGSGHGGRHQGSGLLHSGCSIGQTTSVGRAMVWASYYCGQSGGMGELLLCLVWWYGRATTVVSVVVWASYRGTNADSLHRLC